MREILFRGKRIVNGEWVYGHLCKVGILADTHLAIVPDEAHTEYDTLVGWYAVDPETVGQYTGVTANGTKIFEGDILKFTYTGQNHGVEGVAVVEFENGKFGVKWGWHKEFIPLDGFANTTIEVIGNIHDNPELLKGE